MGHINALGRNSEGGELGNMDEYPGGKYGSIIIWRYSRILDSRYIVISHILIHSIPRSNI